MALKCLCLNNNSIIKTAYIVVPHNTASVYPSICLCILDKQPEIHCTILPLLLQVGGGTFQGHTLNQYAHLHRGHECYSLKLRECTSHRYMTELPDLIHNAVYIVWAWQPLKIKLRVWGSLHSSSIMLQKSCSSNTYLVPLMSSLAVNGHGG